MLAQSGQSDTPDRLYREWQQAVWSSPQGVNEGLHARFITAATRGMKVSPEHRFGFQLVRGIIRSHQNRNSAAVTKRFIDNKASLDIKNAIQHNPKLLGGLALYELAHIYAQDEELSKTSQEINELFKQAIELNPNNVMGRIYHARWLKNQKRQSEFEIELKWIKQTLQAGQHAAGYLYEIVRAHELLASDFIAP